MINQIIAETSMDKNKEYRGFVEAIMLRFRHYPYFVIIGSLSYLINIGLSYVLTEFAGMWYLGSFITAAIISLTFSFILHSALTFRGYLRESHSERFSLYLGFYAGSALVTFSAVYTLTSILGVHYLLSITTVTFFASFITFIINKRFIFLHP